MTLPIVEPPLPPGTPPPSGTPPPPTGTGTVGAYLLLASESTVQVLSPTVVNDVVYSTIQTLPSGVIASIPIAATLFQSDLGASLLGQVAGGIETMMALPMVVAGRGVQTLDANGLLADGILFTVEYVPPDRAGTAITAEAEVPLSSFLTTLVLGEQSWVNEATANVQSVYDNLQSMAGG